jgi:hypothetical protein
MSKLLAEWMVPPLVVPALLALLVAAAAVMQRGGL